MDKGEESRLARALSNRFPHAEAAQLAELLSAAYHRQVISYKDIKLPSPWKEELLMVAHRERLLISMTTSSRRGSAWRDKVLTLTSEEKYHMPRIVRHLVERAKKRGEWNLECAATQCLNEVGESRVGEIIEFLSALKIITPERKITPEMMKRLSAKLSTNLDLHQVVAGFIRCGILSDPIQGSLYLGSAYYEVNTCLYWGMSSPKG